MRIVVCAGGTGGHIYPALAIINKVKEKNLLSEVLYIGTTNRMEHELIPRLGINFVGIDMEGIDRHNIFKNIKVFIKYQKAISKAKEILTNFKPDIVVGAGGYITAPVLIAAHKLGIKTLIHEQNSIPGVSNKIISKYADRICVSLPGATAYFPENKVIYTGNPRSEEIIHSKKIDKEKLGLDKNKKLVVIVMGSLGSVTMTKKIMELIPKFKDKNYQVIIVTGKKYYNDFKVLSLPKNVKLKPFFDDFISVMKSTDLIISRAGASTIAEITAIGLPSILIPSPYVTNNHQYMNAKELEDIGASKLITEEDFSYETIIPSIDEILNDKIKYTNMKNKSLELGVKDSATRIYNEIVKIIEDDK